MQGKRQMRKSSSRTIIGFQLGAAMLAGLLLFITALSMVSGVAVAQQVSPIQVKWEVEGAPTEGRVGARLTFPRLKLTNSGTVAWAASGANELKVGYRWFYGYGAPVAKTNYEEVRANLPQDMPPGGSLVYPNFQVAVPNLTGDFVLHIDLVQPNDVWLQTKGVKDLVLNVSIKAKDSSVLSVAVNSLPLFSNSNVINLSWIGKEEGGNAGISGYDVQFKTSTDNDWSNLLSNTNLTTTQFRGDNAKTYQFRVKATGKSGSISAVPITGQVFTRIDTLSPSSNVDSLPALSPTAFLVRWSSFDNVDGPNTSLFDVQYRESNGDWTNWLSGTPGNAALFQGQTGKTYQFRVRAMDYAGNRGEYPTNPQASTTTSASLNSLAGISPNPTSATPPSGATTLLFPLAVKNGDNSSGTMGYVISNPTDKPADVFIRFNNWAGVPNTKKVGDKDVAIDDNEATDTARVVTLLETVPAKGTKTVWAGNLYLPVYNGWAAIVSSAPVTASAVRLASDGKTIAYNPAETGNKLYLPYIKKQDADTSSYISLANPSTKAITVEITYYNDSGTVIFTEKRDMARLSSQRFSLASLKLADPTSRFTGSAVISAPSPVAATVENNLEDGSVITYPAQVKTTQSSPDYTVFKNTDGGYTTTGVIQNTTNATVTLKIEYQNDNGQVVASQEKQLSPFARYNAWQGSLQIDKFSGKFKVTATGGEVAIVVLGAGPGMKDRVFP